MPIGAIKHILSHPDDSRKIKTLVSDFIREDQQQEYLNQLMKSLQGPTGQVIFNASAGERYILTRGGCPMEVRGDKLYIGPPALPSQAPQVWPGWQPIGLNAKAQQIRLRCWPNMGDENLDTDNNNLKVEVDLIDAVVKSSDEITPHSSFTRDFIVPMPPFLNLIEKRRNASFYANSSQADPDEQMRLKKELIRLKNGAIGEARHTRVSFALSCLILVMVGCRLGMMFKSGNFLSASRCSVVPALVSIVLVVTGQQCARTFHISCPRISMIPCRWA